MSPALATAARPERRPASGAPDRRPALEVVQRRRRWGRRRKWAPIVSGLLVAASLLLVVVGHSELAEGQVRLANVQAQLTAAQITHRQDLASVATLEDPSRIVGKAQKTLHMVSPTQVDQLPHVSLTSPVPPPTVTTTTTSPPASTATSSHP